MSELLKRELQRKAIHLTGSLVPILYIFMEWEVAVAVLAICFPAVVLLEWHRLKYGWKVSFARSHEKQEISAAVYFAFSAFLAVFFFQKAIAVVALLLLAIGDTASGLAGAVLKSRADVRQRDTNAEERGKSIRIKPLEIFTIMFTVCLVIAYLFLPLKVAIAGATFAAIADSVAFELKGEVIDDNLTIPLLSGMAMSIAAMV